MALTPEVENAGEKGRPLPLPGLQSAADMPTVNMSALVPTDADRPPGDRPGERVAGMGIFEGVLGRGRGVPWVMLADREGVCALDGGRDPAREGVLNLELELVLEKVRGGGCP